MIKPTTPLLILLTVATYAQTSLHDKRDGKTYKTVKIGTQIWMAENLNYDAENSKCYENKPENCEKYGRLYNWETAMKSCPKGWHLPNNKEWQILVDLAGGNKIAGTKLKAKRGWTEDLDDRGRVMTVATDEYGFSALPGGRSTSDDNFRDVDFNGFWWSSSSENYSLSIDAYYRRMYNNNGRAIWYPGSKTGLFSVRCVQD